MDTEIIQVRDVPRRDVQLLRSRAAARNISLSGYLRELIHEDALRPEMGEVIGRIARRESIEAGAEEIGSLIDADQR